MASHVFLHKEMACYGMGGAGLRGHSQAPRRASFKRAHERAPSIDGEMGVRPPLAADRRAAAASRPAPHVTRTQPQIS